MGPAILVASIAPAQRIAYPPLPVREAVTVQGQPRLAYPALPIDPRVAPDEFALDDLVEPLPSPEAQQRAADRVMLAQLSQNYRPTPAIWKIGDRDTTIYLFGTVHVLPPGFAWRSAAVDRVVAEADDLLVESVDDGTGLTALAPQGTTGAAPPPLLARIAPDKRAALLRFRTSITPQAYAVVDGLPTWLAAIAIGFVRDFQAGEVPGPGADDWLEARFKADGKPVAAIEDGTRVVASVNAIPEREQRKMLEAALTAPQTSRAELRAATHAWAKGEVGPGSALVVDLAGSSGTAALADPLLDRRNRAWTESLVQRLRRPGTTLFAAGAGHFVGRESVLELLARRGVRVQRLP